MKFKVGEIYKDREGGEYRLIAYIPETREASQLMFLELVTLYIVCRYPNGNCYLDGENNNDILLPEKRQVKLYPALYKLMNLSEYYVSDVLCETCPEGAIRLLTEYPPVIIEVDE